MAANVQRLVQALDFLGAPLPSETRAALTAALLVVIPAAIPIGTLALFASQSSGPAGPQLLGTVLPGAAGPAGPIAF